MEADEYALRFDSGENYRLLTCYVAKERQIAQLRAAGFTNVSVFDREGQPVDLNQPETRSSWLYYLAEKPVKV
ncbi:MAG: hypothetical protein HY300_20375 [Verrucomicrobia bacterium]|nr:hypothetical protein [Verrucomicrobiota bacterium]